MPQTKLVIKGSQPCDGVGLVSDQLRRQIIEGVRVKILNLMSGGSS